MALAKNTICLWYDKDAEAAARFYAETFPNSSVSAVHHAPGDYPSGKAGDVLTANNAAPAATFSAPDTVDEGQAINLALTDPSDPSPEDTAAEVAEQVREAMQGAATLNVPLTVDVGIGPNWREAKS